MPTVLIADKAFDLPVRFVAGQILSEEEANILNREYLKRLGAQIRWRRDRKEIDETNIQERAIELGLKFVFDEANSDDLDDETDPVMIEALRIAEEMFRKEMAAAGVTEIPNIQFHARAIVEGSVAIREQARKRVEARWRIAQESAGV